MIVDPDFFDHWRTGMVIDALQDPCAPIYIMRLWGHCQERKSDRFVMPTRGLKAQCRYPGDADAFEAALVEAGFLERDGDAILVSGWAEKNAKLLAAHANGKRGGRPKTDAEITKPKPNDNPTETHDKPTINPTITQEEPTDNPTQTHRKPIREDKSREDITPPTPPAGGVAERFEKFWTTYPKKVGKDAAKRAFSARKVDECLLATMLAALACQTQSEQWRKDGGQFIPNPATWLNAGRWQDEVTQADAVPSLKPGTDEYFAYHQRHSTWWSEAGFATVWDAANERCYHHNASQFRDGKKCEVAA